MDKHIEQLANQNRFLFEVWLNCQIATQTFYRYGWTDHMPAVGGIEEITAKYRANGTIKN